MRRCYVCLKNYSDKSFNRRCQTYSHLNKVYEIKYVYKKIT